MVEGGEEDCICKRVRGTEGERFMNGMEKGWMCMILGRRKTSVGIGEALYSALG